MSVPGEFPAPGELLPHRPPMLLIGKVLSHEPQETVCEARFGADFAQMSGGAVPAAFGLELIAQAAAVHRSLCLLEAGIGSRLAGRGLLLGSRRLRLERAFLPVGVCLRVIVLGGSGMPAEGALIRFEGRVEDADGETLVSGDATVLESPPDVLPA